jgi:hypothetical protein
VVLAATRALAQLTPLPRYGLQSIAILIPACLLVVRAPV